MIGALELEGFGTHERVRVELDANGTVRYIGASQTGKTTLYEGLSFLFWGTTATGAPFPVSSIRTGAKKAQVVATTGKGAKIGRSITPGRSTKRWINDLEYATEEDFRAALKAVGHTEEIEGKPVVIGRLVLAPLSWVPLAQASGGRPLRDLISKLGGGLRENVAEVMKAKGDELRGDDPVAIKNAAPLRTEANKAAATAEGALTQARTSLFALGKGPEEIDTTAAKALLATLIPWKAYDKEVEAGDRYKERTTNLGAEPPRITAKAISALKKDYEDAQDAYVVVRDAAKAQNGDLDKAKDAVKEADKALTDFDKALEKEECPYCKGSYKPDPDNRKGLVELRQMMVDQEAEAERTAATAEEARAKAEAAGLAIKKKLDDLVAAQTARTTWENNKKALGEAPAEPKKPEVERPTAEQLEAAEKVIDDAKAVDGARREHARLLQSAKDAVAKAETRNEEAAKLAAHYERLVEAVREAPARLFAAGVAKLGELGPVKLVPSDEGVEVLIDGHPWWGLMSRGRLVSADAWFRAGLRRGFSMDWFPMAVDDVQSWTGAWPTLSPALFLETVPGKALERAA